MIPELGHFSLILALVLSGVLAVFPLVGVAKNNAWLMASSQSLTTGVFVMLSAAMVFLGYAMATDDFSVSYVAGHSNSDLPMRYKISAIWGGHEGSMLLWIWILTLWMLAVSVFSRDLPKQMLATVLGVMGIVALGFILFVLLTSNPFDRLLPDVPADGRDLNPLLQDIGLILHPPMLYMGYVGFSVAFAFAVAALINGKMDTAWARWARPWTNIAWVFLTLGISLGSWWAYYELGWGGWWFWDPVENASFMPWLIGTALIHSLSVTEKRGVFKSWTLLLAIFAFSFSLLGTFLVRSGVLTSVHAFASDPDRGFFILALLAISIGGSLTLFAVRAPQLKSVSFFGLYSRESFLFFNNVLLATAAFAILLFTLWPLIADVLGLSKISFGPPRFNQMFNPIVGLLLVLLGVGQLLKWKRDRFDRLALAKVLGIVFAVVAGLGLSFLYNDEFTWKAWVGISLALWVIWSMGISLKTQTRHAPNFFAGLAKLSLGYYGMVMAHLGLAVTVIGVVMVSNFDSENDVRLSVGQTFSVQNYKFVFEGTEIVPGPNYQADRGIVKVYKDGEFYREMFPERRFYPVAGNIMTEVAIDSSIARDLYVALGEPIGEGGDWALRIYVKPFVIWLWLGSLFMGIGGTIAVADKRYRRRKTDDAEEDESEASPSKPAEAL